MRGAALGGVAVVAGLFVGMAFSGGETVTTTSGAVAGSAAAPAAVAASSTDCVLPAGGTKLGLDADQVANARAILAAAKAAGVGDAGARIGVATALVEGQYTRGEKGGPVEGLRNVPYGDRDSRNLFQQRPSQGWRASMVPQEAAAEFFAALKAVPGWQSKEPGAAAQSVQKSAYPTRYAARMSEAQIIVAQVGGTTSGCMTMAAAPSGAPANVAPALAWAASKDGSQYVWGGTGPPSSAGWDCSGLVQDALSRVGVRVPRTSQQQLAWMQAGHGTRVQPGQERPGDIIFPPNPTHVLFVYDPAKKRSIEALQTCRSGMQGAGKDCGVGHFDYQHRIDRGASIWRLNT